MDHNTPYISPQVEDLLGYSPEEWTQDADLFASLLHPEDRERVLVEDARTERTGEPFRMEYRLIARDGRTVWIRDDAVLVRSEEGRPLYWQGVMYDVTERKESEERLREAEEKYRTLIEHMPAVTYIQEVEHHNVVSYIGPQIEALLGFPVQDYVSHPELWIERIHPDDRERVLAEDERTDETGEPFRMEYRKIARDGRVVWVRDEAVLVEDSAGRPRFWQGVMTDITERKEAEEALRESEERFRALTQNSSDIITLLEPDGTIRYESPAVERLLGYRPEELVGKNAFEYIHPEDVERVLSAFVKGLEDRESLPSEEYRFRHKDGSWRYLESVGSNLLDDPKVNSFVVNSRDITERKEAEEEKARRARQAELRADVSAALDEGGALRDILQRCA